MPYDPMRQPAGPEWTGLDEGEQIALVSEYHRRARIKVPNLEVHAAMHVAVENQRLMGDETPVAAALARLMAEGLDRHEAIHSVASVLIGVMSDTMKSPGNPTEAYYREVRALTAASWLSQPDDEAGP